MVAAVDVRTRQSGADTNKYRLLFLAHALSVLHFLHSSITTNHKHAQHMYRRMCSGVCNPFDAIRRRAKTAADQDHDRAEMSVECSMSKPVEQLHSDRTVAIQKRVFKFFGR